MEISNIANITISRETKTVTKSGFGTLMLLGEHLAFTSRTKKYTSTSELITDGFITTDLEYKAAQAFFSQSPNQASLLMGRAQIDNVVITPIVQNSSLYRVTINGVNFDFTSDANATDLEIAAGLVASINGGTEPITATDNLDGTFDTDPDVAGTAYTLVLSSNLTKSVTLAETRLAAYVAIANADPDFYAVASVSTNQTDLESIAAQVLTERRIMGIVSSDPNILDPSDTTNISSVLKSLNNDRTFVIYHKETASFLNVGWLGLQLAKDPGSSTWKFKTVKGVSASSLTVSESKNALAKNANTYETVAGISMTAEGKMCGPSPNGEFIDIIRGIDWLQARMAERIFTMFVNVDKTSYTNTGIASIVAEVRAQLDEGIDVGLISADPAPVITYPLEKDVSSADKGSRTLNDVEFSAKLQGAIHFGNVAGKLTV